MSQIKFLNLDVRWKLLGGHDWDNEQFYERIQSSEYRQNQALAASENSVEIRFTFSEIVIDSFHPENISNAEWRIRLEISKFTVDDHVKTSHHAKFLTFTRHQHNYNHNHNHGHHNHNHNHNPYQYHQRQNSQDSLGMEEEQYCFMVLLEKGRFDENHPSHSCYKLKVIYIYPIVLNYLCKIDSIFAFSLDFLSPLFTFLYSW